jgi:hypothetical protein
MDMLFIIQLVTSFFVGGVFIVLLVTLAERAPKRIAGVIIMFPSTIVLGFFFLAWVLSPGAVAEAAPVAILSTAVNFVFFLGYPFAGNFFARKTESRILQIILGFAVTMLPWFLLVSLIARNKPTNVPFVLFVFAAVVAVSHFILKKNTAEKPIAISYTAPQTVSRAVFAGVIIALVVFLGKTLGPFWGSIFSAFPAAVSSTFILIHWHYGPSALFPTILRLPLGALLIPVFALSAMLFFPLVGFILGTLLSLAVSLATSFLLSKIH